METLADIFRSTSICAGVFGDGWEPSERCQHWLRLRLGLGLGLGLGLELGLRVRIKVKVRVKMKG